MSSQNRRGGSSQRVRGGRGGVPQPSNAPPEASLPERPPSPTSASGSRDATVSSLALLERPPAPRSVAGPTPSEEPERKRPADVEKMVEARKALKVLSTNLIAFIAKVEEVHAEEFEPEDANLQFHQLRTRLHVVQSDVMLAIPLPDRRVDTLPQETLTEFHNRCVAAGFFDSYNVQHEACDSRDFARECGGNLLVVLQSFQTEDLRKWIATRRPKAVETHIAKIVDFQPVGRLPYPNSTTVDGLKGLYGKMFSDKCGAVKKCPSGGEAVLRRCHVLLEQWNELQTKVHSLPGSNPTLEGLFARRASVKAEYDSLRTYGRHFSQSTQRTMANLPVLDPTRRPAEEPLE